MITLRILFTISVLFLVENSLAGYPAFGQPTSYTGGIGMTQIISVDLNGDNYPDLVTANSGSNSIGVMLNNGDGTMLPKTSYNVGTSQRAVVAVDIDNDGHRDLVVTSGGSTANLIILLNSGTGTFQVGDSHDVGDFPISVQAADLDSDTDQDLITANWNDGTITVLINDGNGDFLTSFDYSVGSAGTPGARDVAIADLDGDNDKDLAVLHEGDANVVLLLNDGIAGFSNGGTMSLSSGAVSLKISDLNLDGTRDIAAAIPTEGKVAVLYNTGNALFAAPVYVAVGTEPRALELGDLDRDGDVDIAVSDNTILSDDEIAILWNTGSGNFGVPDVYASGNNMPTSFTINDFDGNGNLDLAVCHFLTFVSGDVSVLLNLLPSSETVPCPCCTAEPGDLNGDFVTDIADLVYLVSFMFSGGFSPVCQ